MFISYGSLKDLLPAIERIARVPGRLLINAAMVVGIVGAVASVLVAKRSIGPVPWLPLVVIGVLLLITAFFAWRRWQLQRAVDQWEEGNVQLDPEAWASDGEIIEASLLDEEGNEIKDENPVLQEDARREAAERRDTWMPAVEAAQRAAIAAAGGTVNAPYLKPDLRVTIASAIALLCAIPVGVLFTIIALFSLV